jgi:hypothetical protein
MLIVVRQMGDVDKLDKLELNLRNNFNRFPV